MSDYPYNSSSGPEGQPRRRRSDRHRQAPAQHPQTPAAGREGPPPRQPAQGAWVPQQTPDPGQVLEAPPPRRPADPSRASGLSYNSQYFDSPYPGDDGGYEERPRRRWPAVLLVLLLLAALGGAGLYFLVPEGQGGLPGKARQALVQGAQGVRRLLGLERLTPPELIKFETAQTDSVLGAKTLFTFTLDGSVDEVRVTEADGTPINGTVTSKDPPKNSIWTVSVILDRPGKRTILPSMRRGDQWYPGGRSLEMTVYTPTPLPPEPTGTPVPPTVSPAPASAVPETPSFVVESPKVTAAPLFVPPETFQPTAAPFFAPTATQVPTGTPAPTPSATPVPAVTAAPFFVPVGTVPALVTPSPSPKAAPAETLTPLPTAAATPASPVTPLPAPTAPPTPSPSPSPTPMPQLPVQNTAQTAPAGLKITEAAYQGAKKLSNPGREKPIRMPGPDRYVVYDGGVFTFRGDAFRSNAAFGTAEVSLGRLSEAWSAPLGSLRTKSDGTLWGLGWTGQPAIVKWAKELRAMMNLYPEKAEVATLKEVIVAAQDGKVYFFDLNDGLPTRDPIDVGYPLKGSVAVDTRGRPLIAFGQGISKLPAKEGDIGFHLYSLIDGKRLYFINGRKSKNQTQYSTNGAFDGTALFDSESESLIVAGENGLLYTVALNPDFKFQDQVSLTLSPKVIYLKGKAAAQADNTVSVESSVAMYGQYAYLADKHGILRCVDTDSMQTVWAVDCGDNTDAAIALGFDPDGSLGLYTGNTALARLKNREPVTIRRLNALTGEEQWNYRIKAKYDDKERSGCKASPVVGQHAIADLVIFTVNMTEDGATVVALDKVTGREVWKTPIAQGSVSSPVAVYNAAGEAWIIQGDNGGRLTMMEGRTGTVVASLTLPGAIEGSPAVYNDMLVVGTASRDARLYGVRIE